MKRADQNPFRRARAALAAAGSAAILALAAPAMAFDFGDTTLQVKPLLVVNGTSPGIPFSAPRGIAIDHRNGEVLLANSGDHRVEIFDLQGNRRARFIHAVRSHDGALVDGIPDAIALDAAGDILVSDVLAGYVDVLDFQGRPIARLSWLKPDQDFSSDGPGALAVAADGAIFVASRGKEGRVHRFAPNFTYEGEWGVTGTEPGQLTAITGLAATPDGNLVVTCQSTQLAVQVFSRDGTYLQGWGRHEIGPGNFSFPSAVMVTADGRIWVSDQIRQVVHVFDHAGAYIGAMGSGGRGPGEFQYPTALASDGDSLVAVAERVGNRFQLLRIR